MSSDAALGPATVDRVLSFWRRWVATPGIVGAVSLVEIGDERLVYAPEHLRPRLQETPVSAEALADALAVPVAVVAEARLAFGDDGTLRLDETTGVVAISGNDSRVSALHQDADSAEWAEAATGEGARRFGVIRGDALVATATAELWADTVGRIGVFTAADARHRGLAGKVGSAAASYALEQACIPMWRSRITNTASARVADRLGFVAIGRQLSARVDQQDERP